MLKNGESDKPTENKENLQAENKENLQEENKENLQSAEAQADEILTEYAIKALEVRRKNIEKIVKMLESPIDSQENSDFLSDEPAFSEPKKAKSKPRKDENKTKKKASSKNSESVSSSSKSTKNVSSSKAGKNKSDSERSAKNSSKRNDNEENLHEGHRARLRKRLLDLDCKNWNEHEVMELFLYFGCPRKDMNEVAHKLINAFGSFLRVVDSNVYDLVEIGGITRTTAEYIVFARKFLNYYNYLKSTEVTTFYTFEDVCAYLSGFFCGEYNENVHLAFLTSAGQTIYEYNIKGASPTESLVSLREIAENCIRYHAACLMIAHTHPSGFAEPSPEDDKFTKKLVSFLDDIGVSLFDHLIWADGRVFSYAMSGRLKELGCE